MNVIKNDVYQKNVNLGSQISSNLQSQIKKDLDRFILPDQSIDGSQMQKEWFPQVTCDVFISHSHQDKEYALFLAGWLKSNFKIESFIDSCVWGYSKDLQKTLDTKYSTPLYSNPSKYYDSVTYTASHVHMMLTNAISFMMDKTECFIFLNTPNALKTFEKADKTESPWIYTEISLSKILRENRPLRPLEETVYFHADGDTVKVPKLKVKYNLDLAHLTPLSVSQLFKDLIGKNFDTKFKALDALYKLK